MRTPGPGTQRHRRPAALAVAALVTLTAACGTQVDKEAYLASLAVEGQPGTAVGGVPVAGAGDPQPGAQPGTSGDAPVSVPVVGGGQPGLPAGPDPGPGPAGGPSRAASGPGAAARTGLSTAVVGDTILVGMHLPITGAAPLPMSWQTDLDVVQRYMDDNPVHGRRMRFVIQDDGYDPATGMAACQKLLDAKPLLAVGHTSPAVQSQCAPRFAAGGLPYLLRGIPRSAISDCPICWFGTPSDDLQGRLLADYALNRLNGTTRKIGIVWQNDQPVAKETFIARSRSRSVEPAIVVSSVPKQADYGSIVVKLQQAGAEIVFLSMPPVDAIKISVQAQSQGYHPTWMGGGTYWNYNMTLESAGMAMDGAVTFSPWPSIDSAAAQAWRAAYQRYRPGEQATDVGLVIWGWANLIRAAVVRAGPQLSRASFVSAMDGLSFTEAYWNPADYRGGNRYGPTSVAVFQADGQAKRWRQVSGFAASF